MIPDLGPLLRLLFFALGFVPTIIVAGIASIFVPIPLWGALLAATVVGGVAVFCLSRNA